MTFEEQIDQERRIIMKFTACKYLDFSDTYIAEKKALNTGKVCWVRDVSYDLTLPALVQFCSKRGRLNSPDQCTERRYAGCADYEEKEHNVPDESITG